jgi:hypothetical protein
MKLFSEKVDSTFTNSSFNVLQVENFSEIFFDVYEIELNKIKYPAEKIGDHEGHPVVSVPVVIGEQECRYPFVLVKGPFNVLFNEKNRILGAQSRKIDSTNVNEELEELIEETSAEDEITYDNLIQEESKVKILEQIREAKQKAAAQINKLKLVAIDEATIDLKVKKQEFDKVLESAKDQLVNEFVYISNNIKNELLDATNSRYEELDDTFSSRIDTLVEELQFDLKSDFKSASKLLDSNIRSLISEIHSAQVIPAINSEISKIAAKVSDKVQKIEEKLDTKLSNKADIALVESINTSVEAIQVANVELNDAINKGVNRALSRVGTVNSKLAETVSVLSEKIDHKINTATEGISEYYTTKIKALEDRTFEINESSRQYFIQLVQESRDNLIQEIRDIKKDAPVEYIVEANNKRTTKSLDSITSELDKKITSKVTDEIARLKQYISMYSSGGGSVAQQFANGGTMNGNLTVAGAISASSYLGLVVPTPDLSQYLPISGGTITGDLVVNNTLSAYSLSADRFSTSQINTLSANIEGTITSRLLRVNGNTTITGNLSVTGTTTFNNTTFSVTSALSVVHVGGGPAMYVGNSGLGDIASFYDIDQNVEVFHIGGANGSFPNVGVNTSEPNKDFTVVGEISATSDITTSGNVYGNNLVYNTGTQTIAGAKTFTDNISSSGSISSSSGIVVDNNRSISVRNNAGVSRSVAYMDPFNTMFIGVGAQGNIIIQPTQNTAIGSVIGNPASKLTIHGNASIGTSYSNIAAPANGLIVVGNVGIGTSSPTERLTVSGNISASGTVIASNYAPASGVAAFIAAPTSDNLRAALTDDTGTGANVFADNATLSNPTLNNYYSSALPDSTATCVRDGPVPKFRLFEDFPNSGATNNTIGTHGWLTQSQGGSGSLGIFTQPFANRGSATAAAGVHFISSGAVSGNYRQYYLNLAGGAAIGQSFQACFALAQTTACTIASFILIGGYSAGIVLDIPNGTLKFITSGAGLGPTNPYTVDIASGLTFATGNLYTGTRYRLYYKIISSTQIDVYLASAPFNSSTWTTMYSGVVTHSAVNYFIVENFCFPFFGITTLENVNKTVYVDWFAVERDILR